MKKFSVLISLLVLLFWSDSSNSQRGAPITQLKQDPLATTTEMQTGTETKPRRVSPALVKAAIDSLAGEGSGTNWTIDQGETNIHAGNIPDLSATYWPTSTNLWTEAENSAAAYLNKTAADLLYIAIGGETDPTALLTAGTDNVKDTHIDWGSGASQVDLADIPGGTAPASAFDFNAATLRLPTGNADPTATAGYIRHDSTVTNFTNGALRYYNGAAIKQLIDMTAATAEGCTDDQVVAYDADNDLFYCKADSTGGFTNLTDFDTQTAWRIFYSNADGDTTELALGSDGEYLKSNGASSAPTWATPSGAAHDAVTLSAAAGNNLLSLSTQEIGLDTQTAAYFFAGPTSGDPAAPAFRAIADADIPAAIARDAELHAAVTLGATATDILGLSTQEVGFDTQTANYVLAGPATGDPAAPTFRALVDADIPNDITITLTAGTYIDVSGSTINVDFTETDDITWGAAAGTSQTWTFDTGAGTDPTLVVDETTGFTFNKPVVATSFTNPKVSGTAGRIAMYEANSTDTHTAGFRGPASITGDGAYEGQLPNARPSSANMVLGWTNVGETGDGTAATPYVQTLAWLDLDNYQAADSDLTTWAGITPGSNVGTFLATPSSANLATAVTGETGSGSLVFGTAPGFTTSANPVSSGGATLGTDTLEWTALYLADSAVIYGQANQSATLTSSASLWTANNFAVTTGFKLPSSDDPDLTATGQVSWDTDGWVRGTDDNGTTQFAIGRKTECFDGTIVAPNDLADATRDAFRFWQNNSGMTFMVTSWTAQAGTDNTTLNIETTTNTGGTNATVDAVEIATDGTGLFYATDSTITAGTITNGSIIWLDFDDTDTPTWVSISICGYYNADVN